MAGTVGRTSSPLDTRWRRATNRRGTLPLWRRGSWPLCARASSGVGAGDCARGQSPSGIWGPVGPCRFRCHLVLGGGKRRRPRRTGWWRSMSSSGCDAPVSGQRDRSWRMWRPWRSPASRRKSYSIWFLSDHKTTAIRLLHAYYVPIIWLLYTYFMPFLCLLYMTILCLFYAYYMPIYMTILCLFYAYYTPILCLLYAYYVPCKSGLSSFKIVVWQLSCRISTFFEMTTAELIIRLLILLFVFCFNSLSKIYDKSFLKVFNKNYLSNDLFQNLCVVSPYSIGDTKNKMKCVV